MKYYIWRTRYCHLLGFISKYNLPEQKWVSDINSAMSFDSPEEANECLIWADCYNAGVKLLVLNYFLKMIF